MKREEKIFTNAAEIEMEIWHRYLSIGISFVISMEILLDYRTIDNEPHFEKEIVN